MGRSNWWPTCWMACIAGWSSVCAADVAEAVPTAPVTPAESSTAKDGPNPPPLVPVGYVTTRISQRFSLNEWTRICYGTLIGESTVLTTSACVPGILRSFGPRYFELVGHGPTKHEATIVGGETLEPPAGETAAVFGVLYLDAPIVGIKPARVDALGTIRPSERFGTAGVATLDDAGKPQTIPLRFKVPLRRDEVQVASVQGERPGVLATSRVPESTSTCELDYGVPLIRADADRPAVVGVHVVSRSDASVPGCPVRLLYATLDARSHAMLDQAAHWTDPCGSFTEVGSCDGEIARRCTTLEGSRRLSSLDCAALGVRCKRLQDGKVGCGPISEAGR